jgi:glycosyltransferase involved in cell wall biosynthesis
MPKVSVIMPAYQAEQYISESIQSIVNQQFTDWELIITDDSSHDHTAAVVLLWADKDKRIRLIRNDNHSGAAQSRNKAIEAASGELIAFLDADDIAYPQRLHKQVSFMQQHPSVGLVAHWLDIIDENSLPHPAQWVWRREKDAHLPVFLLFGNAFALSSVMMKRSLVEQVHGFSTAFEPCEDYALWSEAATITNLHIIPEKLGARREHHHNWTTLATEKSKLQTEQIIKRNISKLGLSPSADELRLHQQLRHRQFIMDNNFARKAQQWLENLLYQNKKYRIYQQQAITEVVGEIWYDYWHLRHQEGLSTLKNYFSSALWRSNSLRKNLLLSALVGKQLLK